MEENGSHFCLEMTQWPNGGCWFIIVKSCFVLLLSPSPGTCWRRMKWGHLFNELTLCRFCPNCAGPGRGSGCRDLFSCLPSPSILRLTFLCKYNKEGRWTWHTRGAYFIWYIQSWNLYPFISPSFHYVSPPLPLSFSLFSLLALWISKCSIWFHPSLIIEATVIQDLPPSAPSAPDPCFSSFLGNRAAYSQASVTS